MTRRFLSRLSGGVAALALSLTTVAVVTESANAADPQTCTASATIEVSPGYAPSDVYSPSPYYGQSASIRADTSATCPASSISSPFVGTVSIEQNTGAGWAAITTSAEGSPYIYGFDTTFTTSSYYRVFYSGGTDSSGRTFPAAYSAEFAAPVAREAKIQSKAGKKAKVTFVVKPAASIKGVKSKLMIKKGNKWKKFSKVKFNKKGKATVFLANSHKNKKGVTPYQLALPAGGGFVAHTISFVIETRYYRESARVIG